MITAIDLLKDNPAAGGVLKGEFSGLRRIRIGNYRVVCDPFLWCPSNEFQQGGQDVFPRALKV
jgi:hypothetical protein